MKSVVVVSRDVAFTTMTERLFGQKHKIIIFSNLNHALDYIYNSIPDLLIVDFFHENSAAYAVISDLKSDSIFGQVTVIGLFGESQEIPDNGILPIDDYIRSLADEKEVFSRIEICLARADRVVETNPLTRLPGNITILKQIQNRIESGDIFAMSWVDVDYFKPFNDKYGFARGDEVLKMLGRLVLNTVRQKQPVGSFVGHIGGDDFVFIVNHEIMEEVAQELIDNFKNIIPTFYDADDRARGYIESVDREGVHRTFPIMGLSIGITHNSDRCFKHYGEMAEVASEMKKFAKMCGGCCFKTDQRVV
ncbi:MAG: diguanylate cyclase [Dissulfurispiraceae bacterium]|nr:diguanylate cyclase [Dissulfurispiraceae bacterium]